MRIYIVKAGDTPRSIAAAAGIDPALFCGENGLTEGGALVPGERVVLPDPPILLRVAAGETPEGAAQRADCPTWAPVRAKNPPKTAGQTGGWIRATPPGRRIGTVCVAGYEDGQTSRTALLSALPYLTYLINDSGTLTEDGTIRGGGGHTRAAWEAGAIPLWQPTPRCRTLPRGDALIRQVHGGNYGGLVIPVSSLSDIGLAACFADLHNRFEGAGLLLLAECREGDWERRAESMSAVAEIADGMLISAEDIGCAGEERLVTVGRRMGLPIRRRCFAELPYCGRDETAGEHRYLPIGEGIRRAKNHRATLGRDGLGIWQYTDGRGAPHVFRAEDPESVRAMLGRTGRDGWGGVSLRLSYCPPWEAGLIRDCFRIQRAAGTGRTHSET